MKFTSRLSLLLALAVCSLVFIGCETPLPSSSRASAGKANGELLVYVGTYTRKDSKGIYGFRLDLKSGALTPLGLVAESSNPSFLALHPSGETLFAANEISKFKDEKAGAVSAFSIDRDTGKLELINQQSSKGTGPCHLSVDATGKNVLVANYGGGNIACLPIGNGGKLSAASSFIQHEGSSVNKRRQAGPHAHSINLAPGNRFAVAADLGLDKVLVYDFDAGKGLLKAKNFTAVAPGAGPRHFAFHPLGQYAYVINELHCTVTAFRFAAATGELTDFQTISTLDVAMQAGYSTAEVQVHPSGRFLYGSNRGHDSIAVFEISPTSGRLNRIQVEPTQGATPRNFGIDPTGNFLLAANQNSDNIVVFRINQQSGRLESTGQIVVAPSPVCIKFLKID